MRFPEGEYQAMNPMSMELPVARRQGAHGQNSLPLPLAFGKRVANIALTAQVQFAYACAMDAQSQALSAGERIEKAWPATPLRDLVVKAYRAQAQSAERIAGNVLAGARQRCGLAFARF